MKTKLRFLVLFAVALAVTAPIAVLETGCPATTALVLAPGGAYTDPVIFEANRAIDQAITAMDGFVLWEKANTVFLSQWPQIGALAKNISTNEGKWVRDAYAARNDYAAAAKAYKDAVAAAGTGPLPPDQTVTDSRAKLDGLLAALASVTTSIANSHSP